jgi:hypothetical protein
MLTPVLRLDKGEKLKDGVVELSEEKIERVMVLFKLH